MGLMITVSRTLTRQVTDTVKALMAFIRAVPTVLWVLFFAVTTGLGSVAAILGMTFHSISYLVKAYAETFEELDAGILEALRASGANWWQTVFQAVVPSTASALLSWTFVRFEINFSVAIAMGATAGAGGIGFDMFMASAFYLDLRELGVFTYAVLIFAILLEWTATRLKETVGINRPV
jgi:phosphonate transport system permease protein